MEGSGAPPPEPEPIPEPRPGGRPFGPLHALLVFLAYFGAQVVAGIAIALVAGVQSALRHRPIGDILEESMPAILLLSVSLGGGAALLVTRALAGPLRKGGRFGLRPATLRQTLAGAAAGLALGATLRGVTALWPPGDPDTLFSRVARTDVGYWSLMLLALVIAPPVEEFVFRGVIYEGLRSRLHAVRAALGVTLLFTGLHATELMHYKPGFAVIALLSLVTLWLRTATGSLLPAVAAHVVYNLCAVAG